MTFNQGMSALEILRAPDGKNYISIDSLVDLFERLAGDSTHEQVAGSFASLATSLRPSSTYGELEGLPPPGPQDDNSGIVARRCACGDGVVSALDITGDLHVIDVNPDAGGEWTPAKIRDGHLTIAPWSPSLDGYGPRLREHECGRR